MSKIFKIVKDTNLSLREKSINIDLPLSSEIEQLGLEMLEYVKLSQDDEFVKQHPEFADAMQYDSAFTGMESQSMNTIAPANRPGWYHNH